MYLNTIYDEVIEQQNRTQWIICNCLVRFTYTWFNRCRMFDACQNTNRNRHLKSQISICTQRDAHSTVTFHALPNLKSFFLQYSAAELDSKHIRKSHSYFCAHFNAWEFSTAAQIEYMLEKRAKKSIQWKFNRVYLLN